MIQAAEWTQAGVDQQQAGPVSAFMNDVGYRIAGGPNPLADALIQLFAGATPSCNSLINADATPDVDIVSERCRAFISGRVADEAALIVIILPAARAGLAHVVAHQATASLWAFTRVAALQWAPQGIRMNAIGLGLSPAGPFEPQEQAGRAGFAAQALSASAADVARTIRAMAAWPSMTGQITRLGV